MFFKSDAYNVQGTIHIFCRGKYNTRILFRNCEAQDLGLNLRVALLLVLRQLPLLVVHRKRVEGRQGPADALSLTILDGINGCLLSFLAGWVA